MTPAARIAAAIDVLNLLEKERRPLQEVLKDWGIAHRYAGSKDRTAIASIAYDCLRVKLTTCAMMGAENPRANVIGMLKLQRNMSLEAIEELFMEGGKYAPSPLTDLEKMSLKMGLPEGLPAHVLANCPKWLFPKFNISQEEFHALTARAPLDIRVNELKAARDTVKDTLSLFNPEVTPHSPLGLRFKANDDGRLPAVSHEVAFVKGEYEVQDEGSQLISLLTGVKKGDKVIDLCAGGGGKALAMAAMMENEGEIYATDIDRRRLTPLFERAERAGASIIELRHPVSREHEPLKGLTVDTVVIDAPCSGTGTWRRNPDAKWRMREGALTERLQDQAELLNRAQRFLKIGGKIVYMTCSLLRAENDAQVEACLEKGRFKKVQLNPQFPHIKTTCGIQLTPHTTGTDGFYVAMLERVS